MASPRVWPAHSRSARVAGSDGAEITERAEVLRRIASSHSNKEVAQLDINIKTVESSQSQRREKARIAPYRHRPLRGVAG